MRQKITCWYRVLNSKWMRWNHFTYGWTDRKKPLAVSEKQSQMWKDVTWDKEYGYLVDGVVKEFSCDVCPYCSNCENDTCEEAFEEYEKRQREKAIERVKVRADNVRI